LACRAHLKSSSLEGGSGVRRLALFWLVCAATGFAAAASVAFLLGMAIDHRLAWRRPVPMPIAHVFERFEPHPRNTIEALLKFAP
jgi:elongation factor P hydroxylase